ncbi:MAG: NAD(P)/FAD-dependent oxidoreductase, partial [Clostridiales bacterium]|nr:NAD(P)/FAD-dependent oxidoreductase [Clostridiales bacterium]
MKRKIIIIGAGVAGLTAAIYAQRSGFDVTLAEQHKIVGGMCTSWKRKGYLFEGAVHWLTGSSPETEAYQMWKDTGALGGDVPVSLHDPFRSVEWEGQTLHLYRDIEKTVEHLVGVSPDDEQLLRKLVKEVKAACNMQMPVFDVKGVKAANPKKMSFGFLLKMMPAFPVASKYGKITCGDFSMRFKHPGIQRLFRIVPDEYAATSLVFTLATLHTGDGGYPEGGSLAMVQRMAKVFSDLGGRLLLNTRVRKVIVEDGKAAGVTLEDGALADGTLADGRLADGRLADG